MIPRTERECRTEIRTRGSSTVNRDRARKIEGTSEDRRLIREIDLAPTGGTQPVGILQGGTVHPVIGAGMWAAETGPVLISGIGRAEMPVVVAGRECSSRGNRMRLTVWIEEVEMPEWPAIGEAPVARACRHPEATVVSPAAAAFPEVVVEVGAPQVVVFRAAAVVEGSPAEAVAAVAAAAEDDR